MASDFYRSGAWLDRTFAQAFMEVAHRRPAALAVISDERDIDYAELRDRALAVAARLDGQGVAEGDRVLLVFRNTAAFAAAYVGCQVAGVVPVPFHPDYGWEVLASIGRRLAASAILLDPREAGTRAVVAEVEARIGTLRTVASLEDPSFFTGASWRGDLPRDPAAPMVILMSSGSSGEPKLIVRSHRAFGGACRRFGAHWGAAPARRFCVGGMVTHAAGLGWGLHASLMSGACLVLPADRRPRGLLAAFERWRPQRVFLVPSQLVALLNEGIADADIRAVMPERVIVGGEYLSPPLGTEIVTRFGCELQNTYGLSEGFCTATDPTSTVDVASGSVGRPCFEQDELRVVDDDGRDAAPGTPGRLFTRGPGLLERYWDGVGEAPADGFLDTGDCVRIEAGRRIFMVGRAKRIINRRGIKISPEDIESRLLLYPGVRQAVVVGIPDAACGERVGALVAVAPDQRPPTLAEVTQYLTRAGIGSLRHPDEIATIDRLPLNPVGKTDWRAAAGTWRG